APTWRRQAGLALRPSHQGCRPEVLSWSPPAPASRLAPVTAHRGGGPQLRPPAPAARRGPPTGPAVRPRPTAAPPRADTPVPRRRPQPASLNQALDRDRDPQERPRLAPRQLLLRTLGLPPSPLAGRRDEGAQLGRRPDPLLVRLQQLQRRYGPAPQRRRDLGQRRRRQRRGWGHQSFDGSAASAALNSSTSARYRFHAGRSASRSAAVSLSPAARVAAASRSLFVIGTVWGPITTCECEIV